jgi:hypothetical protein
MKIVLPAGYEIPDNAKPGEPFEAVVTLVAEEDGSFEIKAIDGMEIEEDEEPEEDEASAIKLAWNEPDPFE